MAFQAENLEKWKGSPYPVGTRVQGYKTRISSFKGLYCNSRRSPIQVDKMLDCAFSYRGEPWQQRPFRLL